MSNIDLNPGGLIGALLAGAVAGVLIYSNNDPEGAMRRPARLIVFAIVGGAFAGNYLWGMLFGKEESDQED